METHSHTDHHHVHGPNCGHLRVKHHTHVDYVHDGHLHNVDDELNEHVLEVTDTNPDVCRAMSCAGSAAHRKNAEAVPHGGHVDYLVDGRLHHVHGDHCDDHGPVNMA